MPQKGTSHFGIVWNLSRCSNGKRKHLTTTRGLAGIHPLSSVIIPGVSSMERARRSAVRQRLVEEIYIPRWSQARGGKRNPIKYGDRHRNGHLSLTSQK